MLKVDVTNQAHHCRQLVNSQCCQLHHYGPPLQVTVLPVSYPSTKWLEDSLKTLPPSILFKSWFFQWLIPQLSSSVLSFNKMTGSWSQNATSLCFKSWFFQCIIPQQNLEVSLKHYLPPLKSRFFQCVIPQHHDWKSVSNTLKHSLPQSSSTLQVKVLPVSYPSTFFQRVVL